MLHKSQIFFWLLISFLTGIFTASLFALGNVFIYVGLMAAISLIGVFGYNKSFNGKLLLAGFIGIAFLFGVVRFNSANFDQDRLGAFTDLKVGQENIEVVVNGYVDDEPVNDSGYQRIILRVKEIIAGDKAVLMDDRILITTNGFPKFSYGNAVSAVGALEKPQNFGVPLEVRRPSTGSSADTPSAGRTSNGIDYITYLKRQNIRATMLYPEISMPDKHYDTPSYHSVGNEHNEHYDSFLPAEASAQAGTYHNIGNLEKAKVGLYRKIFALKNKFESAVDRSVSEPNAAFINGILLGTRQNISDDLKEAFNKTGITHVLAISGYNIMIISWAMLMGLTIFFRRRTAFWLSVAIIALFTILTGASASVVRAAIMGLLLLFAQGYGRLYDPKNSIILAGAAMAYFNPFVLSFDIGFQLSFVAVLGLMYLYPRIDVKLKKIPEFGKLKEITLMTLSAQIAVAPLLIYYFKNFSFVSLPTNVLILPFIPAAMLAGFISGLAGMVFLPLGQVAGWFAWAVTTYQIEIVRLFAGF